MITIGNVQVFDGVTFLTENVTPPPSPNLMIEFNSQPAWSDQIGLFLYESNLAGPTIPVDVTIDWGDGNTEYAGSGNTYSHTYATSGTYNIQVYGNALGYFGLGYAGVVGISSWGNLQIVDLSYAVEQCSNLVYVPNNIPSSVLSLYGTFSSCTIFNDSNVSQWDTSNVTDMGNMFESATSFNQSIGNWDVSNVTYMPYMFNNATSFNQDISSWDVNNVISMQGMFNDAISFNQDLSTWCPPNILSEPIPFDDNTPAWVKTGRQPLWGTCYNPNALIVAFNANTSWSNNIDLFLYTSANYGVDVNINWGDGTIETANSPSTYSHAYSSEGNYTISIYGNELGYFGAGYDGVLGVTNWGNLQIEDLSYAFSVCPDLIYTGPDLPSSVSNLLAAFEYCSVFNDANISLWNTDNVTDIGYIFRQCFNFNQPLNNWNTSNVLNMGYAFDAANSFNQDLDNWNTANVTSFEGLFNSATSFNGNLNTWNLNSATGFWDATYIFANASSFNKPLNNWNTSNVISLISVFDQATSFNSDIGSWDTSNVVDMSSMFRNAAAFNSNISSWDTSNVTHMPYMFEGASNFNANISNWNTSNVIYMESMFENATAFNQDLSNWCVALIPTQPTLFDDNATSWLLPRPNWGICNSNPVPSTSPLLLTANTALSSSVTMGFYSDEDINVLIDWGDGNYTQRISTGTVTYNYASSNVYTISVQGKAKNFTSSGSAITAVTSWGDLIGFNSLASSFSQAYNLTSVPATLHPNVINLQGTFNFASSFNSTNVTTWDTSNVTDMSGTFAQALIFNQDISGWNTSNVTNMYTMFQDAQAFNQNIDSWDVSNVTNMGAMFTNADAFNQSLNGWDTSNVSNMFSMFSFSTYNNNITSWNTVNVINMSSMFAYNNSFNQAIGSWNTSNVVTIEGMFFNGSNFNQNLNSWNTSNITNMSNVFLNSSNFNGQISSWDTSNATTMLNMFSGAGEFNQNIGGWNTSKVTNMGWMFNTARKFNQNIGSWNTSNVANMRNMFANANTFNQNLSGWCVTNIPSKPTSFDTGTTAWVKTGRQPIWGTCNPLVMTFSYPFSPYTNRIVLLGDNVNATINWGDGVISTVTSNAEQTHTYSTSGNYTVAITGQANGIRSTSAGFYSRLTGVTNWGNLIGFDNLSNAFYDSEELITVPNYLPPNVSNIANMFSFCTKINDSNIALWDTSNVSNMYGLFDNAYLFNANIANWNTSNVTNMAYTFSGADVFNRNIGNWDVSNVTTMDGMFYQATLFNQNLTGWCVTNIVTEPVSFSSFSALTAGNKPVWGTCPP